MEKKLFAQLVESIKQMKAIQRGELAPGRVVHLDPAEARPARTKTARAPRAAPAKKATRRPVPK